MKTRIFQAARMAAAGMAAYMLASVPHTVHKPAVPPPASMQERFDQRAGVEAWADAPEELEMTLEEFCTAFATMQDEKFAQITHDNTATYRTV